jgi:Holliday junction DNA helicase RuvA
MIAKLRGRLDSIGTDFAVVDVGGVGYLVFCGTPTIAGLPHVGEAVELSIETHVREDHIHLFGFATAREREMFTTLMTVQGVGAKVALAILSALSSDQIVQAIGAGDEAAFKRANGVGGKLAARIVVELKNKVAAFAVAGAILTKAAAPSKGAAKSSAVEDAVSALVNLGYGRMEAFGAASRAAQASGEGANFQSLIKASLRELGGDGG